ncbi:hypothetical protein GCM10007415_38480 [Parapedobacter pyrenivorans]|uniref:Outer membrane protein beta-barrel domain-containing protein n=1 Tax=Parapedobacter pyrenivorans TaxID=1305674 RepID=A0A917MG46_9SPHI|nr:outer membrane beta-barrel protein [Parapedobacter pyrenivorans]GGG99068.1 hypothetical protein GCM10007415_38480 [Parapedobacter pyrenivorans]
MRKTSTLILAILACNALFAQTAQQDTSRLKAAAKTFGTELNFNPFNGQINLNNSLNQIKFRYFAKEDLALRLGFVVGMEKTLNDNQQPYGTNSFRFKDEKSSSTYGVNAGIEKHFRGTLRLSPYIGADLTFTRRSLNQELIEGESILEIDGGWYQTVYNNGNYYRSVLEYGYNRFGVAAFTGFDFYMAKNFFFGYEFNIAFAKTVYDEVEEQQKGTGSANENHYTDHSDSSFGPRLTNGIRIGYIF